ncbi:MAG TPA: chemotaxis protein CheA, partial [Anaeromyxobacter sp.]|nr:chemotaxis protein CheA [Anaeromyxobacter sp.]
MSDARSVMKEFRQLERKRLAEGLSVDEEARYGELRDLIGAETGPASVRPGFDVNAAAARLRESLLPAGLRNRPPPEAAPAPPVEPEQTIEEPAIPAAYEDQPLSQGDDAPALDALFDPGTLANEDQVYDPNAPAYDPNAPAYDPNAPAYDPNAAAYDPNAPAYDPNAPAYDPNAAAY